MGIGRHLPPRRTPPPTLVGSLHRTFLHVTAGVAATLVVTLALLATLLLHIQPGIERLTLLVRDLRVGHERMLDRQADLRIYLATGDDAYLPDLDPDLAGDRDLHAQAMAHVGDDPTLIAVLVELRVRKERWLSGWTEPVDDGDTGIRAAIERSLGLGDQQFEHYSATYDHALATASDRRDRAFERQRDVLIGGVLVEALVCLALLVLARRRHEQLREAVVEPIEDLVATMRRIGSGDLSARSHPMGPLELREVADGLDDMTAALSVHAQLAHVREADAVESARRLRELLTLARDIAGSLSERYVAVSMTEAALRVTGAERVVLWHLEEGATELRPVYDTASPRERTPNLSPIAVGTGPTGIAVRDARAVVDESDGRNVSALPTVVGARVTGAFEVTGGTTGGTGVQDALETLAIHGGAALEAARLHHRTEELSQVDPLTGLFNRRRLEADLAVECDRGNRYRRPLGFIMVDVDHFKALNDEHGHQHGDEVLRRIAAALAQTVRSSDTVYRYGGEEFAVLVREGDAPAAALLAERLRMAVSQGVRVGDGSNPVTASFGVAELTGPHTTPQALVSMADEALYTAKRAGRDRVVVSGVGSEDVLTIP